jgi:hypothetical protein
MVAMNQLNSGATLAPGQQLTSPAGTVSLVMQADGNLVLYRASDSAALWDTGVHAGPKGATMDANGNLECVAADGAYFSTDTGGNPGAVLYLQDDGGFGVAAANGNSIWLSGTHVSRIGARYTIECIQLHAAQIRSAHNDTDHFTQSLKLLDGSGQVITDYGSKVWEIGNIGAGWSSGVPAAYTYTAVLPPAGASLSWAWTVVNAGGGSAQQVRQWGDQTADSLASKLVSAGIQSLAGGNIWVGLGEIAAAGVVEGLAQLWNLMFADCDGAVITDAVLLDRQTLSGTANRIPVNPSVRDYPGKNSPSGCGANSDYQLSYQAVVLPGP